MNKIKAESCRIYQKTKDLQARDKFILGAFKKERGLVEILDKDRGDREVFTKIFGRDGHQAEIDLLG